MVTKKTFLNNLELLLKIIKREISREKKSLKTMHETFEKLRAERRELKNKLELIKSKGIPILGKIPLIGSPFKKNYFTKYNEQLHLYRNNEDKIKKLQATALFKSNLISQIIDDGKKLQTNATIVLKHFENLPNGFDSELMRFVNKIEFLKRRNVKDIQEESYDILKKFNAVFDNYVFKESVKAEVSSEENNTKDTIFLPIPIELRHEAKKLGAKYNPNAGFGSRMYVSLNEDKDSLNSLQSMLPLAYRNKHTTFHFPPIRHHGKKQNLWSIFTKDTWNYIRSINYARSGNRCMICGNQGGKLIDSVYEDDKNKRYSVECHEIWEWKAPDVKSGVGIQKLKEILVLCVDCHMMFHEEFAVHKARNFGKEKEVEQFLRKRMMLVNHMTEANLLDDINNERDKAAQMNGIDNWIVDLSNLAEQDYMKNHIPVIVNDNPAGITPDMIAGIEFEDETGLVYEAIDAVEIYTSLVSRIEKELQDTAMPFEVKEKEQTQTIKLKMF